MAKSNASDPVLPTDTAPAATLRFEAALAELEQIVRSMEEEQLPLEDSIAAYKRGAELLGHCQGLLKDAEHRVQMLENGVLRDIDIGNGEAR